MMLPMLAALALAAGPVSMQYEGTLKDAIQEIAKKGGLNVVAVGTFDERVQVHLADATAEEALDTVAAAYQLEVTRQGKVWVIKRGATQAAAPVPVVPVVAATPPTPPSPPEPATAPAAPVGLATPEAIAEEARAAAESAREGADAARERAEALREQAEAVKEQVREAADAEREKADALREQAEAQAELAKHRVATGGPVTVEKGQRVETAVAYGGPVIVEEGAEVTGDAVAFGGDVVVKRGATVRGDAVSFGGDVVKEAGATVRGDTVSMGGKSLGAAVAKGALRTQKTVQADDEAEDHGGRGFGRSVAGFLARFAVFFGLGFLLMMFAPQRMRALETTIRNEPGKNGLAGFLGLIAAVPLTVMLVVTVIGIPVALLMWVGLALAVPLGLAVVANAVGASLPTGRLRKTQAIALGLGLLALMLAAEIPVLGPMLLSLALFVSLGAIIRTRFGQPPRGTPMVDTLHGASVA
jgi:hypothetical protein